MKKSKRKVLKHTRSENMKKFAKVIVAVLLVMSMCVPLNVFAEPAIYRAYVQGADSIRLGRANVRFSLWWYTDATTNKKMMLPGDAVVEIYSPAKGVTYTIELAYWKGDAIEKFSYQYKAKRNDEFVSPFSVSLNDIKSRKGKKAILRITVKAKKGKKVKSFDSVGYIENGKLVHRNVYR